MATRIDSLPAGMWSSLMPAAPQKAKRVPYRSYPLSLRKPLGEAINRLESWLVYLKIDGEWHDHLREYRENKVDGVTNPAYIIRMNQRHPGLLAFVEKVDESFYALHNYRPEENLTEGVYKLAQSRNSTNPRPQAQTRDAELKKIGAWLKKKKYQHSTDKTTLRDEAMKFFTCSRTDVTDAARLAKLTRSYSKSPS
jgi:hypothetical protein